MIFVVATGPNRSQMERRDIRDRIYKELNQEGKHQVVMMPADCSYDVINDYNGKDVKVIIKEIEKG